MEMDGQQVHVHCGGVHLQTGAAVQGCFALKVSSTGEVSVEKLAPLGEPLAHACAGSDGGRLVVAGGLAGEAHGV